MRQAQVHLVHCRLPRGPGLGEGPLVSVLDLRHMPLTRVLGHGGWLPWLLDLVVPLARLRRRLGALGEPAPGLLCQPAPYDWVARGPTFSPPLPAVVEMVWHGGGPAFELHTHPASLRMDPVALRLRSDGRLAQHPGLLVHVAPQRVMLHRPLSGLWPEERSARGWCLGVARDCEEMGRWMRAFNVRLWRARLPQTLHCPRVSVLAYQRGPEGASPVPVYLLCERGWGLGPGDDRTPAGPTDGAWEPLRSTERQLVEAFSHWTLEHSRGASLVDRLRVRRSGVVSTAWVLRDLDYRLCRAQTLEGRWAVEAFGREHRCNPFCVTLGLRPGVTGHGRPHGLPRLWHDLLSRQAALSCAMCGGARTADPLSDALCWECGWMLGAEGERLGRRTWGRVGLRQVLGPRGGGCGHPTTDGMGPDRPASEEGAGPESVDLWLTPAGALADGPHRRVIRTEHVHRGHSFVLVAGSAATVAAEAGHVLHECPQAVPSELVEGALGLERQTLAGGLVVADLTGPTMPIAPPPPGTELGPTPLHEAAAGGGRWAVGRLGGGGVHGHREPGAPPGIRHLHAAVAAPSR